MPFASLAELFFDYLYVSTFCIIIYADTFSKTVDWYKQITI